MLKPQNELFLNNLWEKYQDFQKTLDSNNLALIQKEAINFVVQISEIIANRYPNTGKLWEDKTTKLLTKLTKKEIPTIDNLLDEILNKIKNILEIETIELETTIYKKVKTDAKIMPGNWELEINEYKETEKYNILMKIL